MSKESRECKDCDRAEFWTDPYYGRVGECGEGQDRVRINQGDKCHRELTERPGCLGVLKMLVGPVFSRQDMEDVENWRYDEVEG